MAIEKNIKINVEAKEAIADVNELKQGIQDTDAVASQSKPSFAVMKAGVRSVGLAFKAMGIGLIVAAFMGLKDMMAQNQVIMDKISVATESMRFIFGKIIEIAVKVGETIGNAFKNPIPAIIGLWKALKKNIANRITGLIDTFKALGKVLKGVFTLDMSLIKEGANEAADGFKQLSTGMTKVERQELAKKVKEQTDELKRVTQAAVAYARALTKLRNEVKLAEANQRMLQLTYQKEAEIQRQIRDDISLTFEERIAANEKLGKILDEQFEKEKALAQKKIDLAQLELSQNKGNIDLQVALINAKTEMADLDERITGQRSEQLTNLKALEKEQADAIQEQIDLKNEQLAKEQAARDRELADAKLQADKLLEIQRKADAKKKTEKEDHIAAVKAMEIQAAQSILGSLGQLAGEGTRMAKATALAQILINTAEGVSAAIKAGAGLTFPANLGAIASGVASVLAGIASAKGILAKVPGGPDGGGDENVDVQAGPSGLTGSLIPNMEAVNQPTLGEPTPIQAYVVENDISNAQALQEELEIQSTL